LEGKQPGDGVIPTCARVRRSAGRL
jgi:hypothetical protein